MRFRTVLLNVKFFVQTEDFVFKDDIVLLVLKYINLT